MSLKLRAIPRRRGAHFPARLLTSALTVLATSACADASGRPPAPRTYAVIAPYSGRCLDVEGASMADGATVMQWDCTSLPHQLWTLQARQDGAVRLVAVHSGKCLSIAPAGSRNEGYAVQGSCNGSGADEGQWWVTRRLSTGRYRLASPDGSGCLDVEASGIGNGAHVLRHACGESAPNQEWELVPASPATTPQRA